MINNPAFSVEPWAIRECRFDLDVMAQTESVFALSNGHIGMRGNLDEGEPHALPGTYVNSVYELRPLPYAEAGYGYPESSQTVINVTNGKIIRLLVDDEPFDVRYGELQEHERILDFRAGTLTRNVLWTSPAGRTVRIKSTRLVSFTQRAVAAMEYIVEPVDGDSMLVIQSELVANESLPDLGHDPRSAGALESPLVTEDAYTRDLEAVMVHRTARSGLRIASAMTHVVDGPEGTQTGANATDTVSRLTVASHVDKGKSLRLVKYVSYGWSSLRSRPALHDQVVGELAGVRLAGWEGLVAEQRQFLDEFWDGADVDLDGDAEVQQAVRFGLFHVLQSAARAERRPIAAKGLTGPGYDGHTFWDTEMYILPVLTYTYPRAVKDALSWRHSILDQAEERAASLGLDGAAFPWRTIGGAECSAYWPAGTAAFHINADIAHAVISYIDATEDEEFEKGMGLELLVSTARLWRSLGQHDMDGRFRIDGVTGPDEYSALADNNVYTNLMAQQNLIAAADAATKHRVEGESLGVTHEEVAAWRDAANAVVIPYDERLGVHSQSEGFTGHARWDFEGTDPDQYPLLLHFPYFDLYRKQVVKQADLVLAMQTRTDAFTDEEKARNFTYYEAVTVRDSSLSACTQSVIAAEVGQLELAHDYLGEAALMDLGNLEHNTRDGLHIASLAGAWTALVLGFGGMRVCEGVARFSPRLPGGITRLCFRIRYRGRLLRVEVLPDSAKYELIGGEPLLVTHHGDEFLLGSEPVTAEIQLSLPAERPAQPKGREPLPRHAGGSSRQG